MIVCCSETHAKCLGFCAFKSFNLRRVQRHPDRSPITHQYHTIRCKHKHNGMHQHNMLVWRGYELMHSPCILRIIFAIHTLFMCTIRLVCDERRTLTFAHWRSALCSRVWARGGSPQCWCHEGRRRLNKEKFRLARSRAQLTHPTGPFSRKYPCKRSRVGIFNQVMYYVEDKSWVCFEKLQTNIVKHLFIIFFLNNVLHIWVMDGCVCLSIIVVFNHGPGAH